ARIPRSGCQWSVRHELSFFSHLADVAAGRRCGIYPIKNTRNGSFLSCDFEPKVCANAPGSKLRPPNAAEVGLLPSQSIRFSVRPRHVETERLGGFEAERHCGVTQARSRCSPSVADRVAFWGELFPPF